MPMVELSASDGHHLGAHFAAPQHGVRGGIVVVQEIFGVNAHIRDVADAYAREGYEVVAPALFDRVERGVELEYDASGFAKGRGLVGELSPEGLMADLAAARDRVAGGGRVGLVGYCFGGAVVWVAAAQLEGVAAAVSYYGSRIARHEDLVPRVPVMLHVGREDASFPLEVVYRLAGRHPDRVSAHEYDAGHGFNCDLRPDFVPEAASLARERTLAFLGEHVG